MKKWSLWVLISVLLLGTTTLASAESSILFRIGQDISVAEGTTARQVVAVGGQVTVSGVVEHHIVVIGGSAVLTPTAIVGGNILAIGGVIVVGKGADVQGSMTEIDASDIADAVETVINGDWEGWSWVFAILSIFIFIVILIMALLVVAFIPKPLYLVASAIQGNVFRVILWGLAGLVSVVPLAVLLTISVIGIVLIPLELTLVACAVLIGFSAVAQIIGRKIFSLLGKKEQSMLRETFWGLVVLWLVGWVPYLGMLVKVCAVVIGLGGVFLTRFGTAEPAAMS
jgi:MFS family permease